MRRLGLLLLLLPLVSSSYPLLAGDDKGVKEFKESKNVKFTLVVILASEEGDKIDPRLKAIAEEIRKLHPELKSFTLQTMITKSVPPNVPSTYDTVAKKSVTITVKHGANRDNKVSLSVNAPTLGQIDYETVCGKYLPIVTRCETNAKQRLILAIRVQPCNGPANP
jgi:hypothetical protein